VLFDIDGTLTATNEIDRDCFLEAFRLEFGIAEIDTDWLSYEQTTDRGITAEIFRRASRSEDEEALARHRRRFVDLLRTCAQQIRPIAGVMCPTCISRRAHRRAADARCPTRAAEPLLQRPSTRRSPQPLSSPPARRRRTRSVPRAAGPGDT
jgi:phosphoglycolate phosphatase-like HAD superfamily hydrolase